MATIGTYVQIIGAILLCVTLYRIIKRYVIRRAYKLPPGPGGLPLLGNLKVLSHLSLWDHKDLYGDVSYVNIGGADIVVLNSIDVIREALMTSPCDFDNRPATFAQQYMTYKSIAFNSPLESHWKCLRTLLHSRVKAYDRGVEEIERAVSNELDIVMQGMSAKRGHSLNLMDFLEPSLCNVILILIAGMRFDYDHNIIKNIKGIIDSGNSLANPLVDTLLLGFPMIRHLPLGIGKIYQEHMQLKHEVMQLLFYDNKYLSETELSEKTGLVYDFIREQRRCDWLTDEVLLGGLDDVINGANITTKFTLYVFFLILLNHADVQDRIQQEIEDVIGKRRPCLADRHNMPYTQASILELMRYSTIVPIALPRSCNKDSEIRGYTIPKGCAILSNVFRIHHDPDIWDDPWQFDPCRFLDEQGCLLPAMHPVRKNVVAFGVASRMCLGEAFAKTRVFLYITHLMQRFHFRSDGELPSCDPRNYVVDFIIHPHPYTVIVENRE